jgi:hypothetical protein
MIHVKFPEYSQQASCGEIINLVTLNEVESTASWLGIDHTKKELKIDVKNLAPGLYKVGFTAKVESDADRVNTDFWISILIKRKKPKEI